MVPLLMTCASKGATCHSWFYFATSGYATEGYGDVVLPADVAHPRPVESPDTANPPVGLFRALYKGSVM